MAMPLSPCASNLVRSISRQLHDRALAVRVAAILALCIALVPVLLLAQEDSKGSAGTVGTSFPSDFPVIKNFYLGVPVIGFGAEGRVHRIPVIFLHGNNDTPFATACNPFGYIHNMAQYFANNGYRLSELWGLGYQGDQCDLVQNPTHRSGVSHTTAAAVPMLRAFVKAVMEYTGARQVDIVGHSLGVTVAREWMLQDNAYDKVRALVAIDGPNHGIIDCSPSPDNYFQLAANGGFTPNSAVCDEYGSDHTQLLTVLNGAGETPGRTRYLVIRNVYRSSPESGDFVYESAQDGVFPPLPAQDNEGTPHDFSDSALLAGAPSVDLTGQGQYDAIIGTAHLGILNSPEAWRAAFRFLHRD
jgi:pimeloyl-ACP methyl ester carboxylesterase